MAFADLVKLAVGALYLIGAILLQPGFFLIIPERVLEIPRVDIFVPIFHKKTYADGVHILLWGMGFVFGASVLDFGLQCLTSLRTDLRTMQLPAVLVKVLGMLCQVVGSLIILLGCVVFLPEYSLVVPPKVIMGRKAPDLGNYAFKVSSIVYFIGGIAGLVGTLSRINAARRRGQETALLLPCIPAFLLFMATSICFFVNGSMPTSMAVQAGQLRMAGAICLLIAVILLTFATFSEVWISSRARALGSRTDLPGFGEEAVVSLEPHLAS